MKRIIYCIVVMLLLAACDDWESDIQIVNNLPGAVIRNVQWGTIPMSRELLPGQSSTRITIAKYSYYKLPATARVQFYIEVDGETVYVETREKFFLGKDDSLLIEISDTTKVINRLLGRIEN